MSQDLLKNLAERSKTAFNSRFRALLEDSVTVAINVGITITPINDPKHSINKDCRCPLGCLPKNFRRYPSDIYTEAKYPYFSALKFDDFIQAFDVGIDCKTAESALGLLYREKFVNKRV